MTRNVELGVMQHGGRARRLRRLFSANGKTLIVPVDDSLIFGPIEGLEDIDTKLDAILAEPPNAVLGFPGIFRGRNSIALRNVGGIVNLTASTSRSLHTRKVQVSSVLSAVQMGLEAVAVHVNIGSEYEPEMLETLGRVARDCDHYGMPLLAIMYPRTEGDGQDDNYEALKAEQPQHYAAMIAHAARVAVDLGADIVKTKYTGDRATFRKVVVACGNVPVVIAGGPQQPVDAALQMAEDALDAGAAGVSFGRNVFGKKFPAGMLSALKALVDQGKNAAEAGTLIRQAKHV